MNTFANTSWNRGLKNIGHNRKGLTERNVMAQVSRYFIFFSWSWTWDHEACAQHRGTPITRRILLWHKSTVNPVCRVSESQWGRVRNGVWVFLHGLQDFPLSGLGFGRFLKSGDLNCSETVKSTRSKSEAKFSAMQFEVLYNHLEICIYIYIYM